LQIAIDSTTYSAAKYDRIIMTNKKMLPNIIPASAKGAGTLSGPVARITLKSVEYPTI
jgi:hypothetical protein